jgi:restriction system protein
VRKDPPVSEQQFGSDTDGGDWSVEREDFYDVLGVARDSDSAEIKASFRKLSPKVHPDQGGTDALFRLVHEAYSVLSDPKLRAEYDWKLSRGAVDGAKEDCEPNGTNGSGYRAGSTPPPPPPPGASSSQAGWVRPPPPANGRPRSATPRTANRVGRNPSTVLATLGVLVVALASAIGVSAAALLVLGVILFALGVCGLIGHSKVARLEWIRLAGMQEIDYRMTWREFEGCIAFAFQRAGYHVQHASEPRDRGADMLVIRDGVRTVVHVKHCAQSIGEEAVREAAAARYYHQASYAMVVTNSVFTPSAWTLASVSHVALWDRQQLAAFLATQMSASPRTGVSLLGAEITAGLPTVLHYAGVVLLGGFALLASILAGTPPSGRSRRRRRRRL